MRLEFHLIRLVEVALRQIFPSPAKSSFPSPRQSAILPFISHFFMSYAEFPYCLISALRGSLQPESGELARPRAASFSNCYIVVHPILNINPSNEAPQKLETYSFIH